MEKKERAAKDSRREEQLKVYQIDVTNSMYQDVLSNKGECI